MKQENSLKSTSFLGGGFRTEFPRCETCKWFNWEHYVCKAFPEGIPDEKLWADENEVCNGKYRYEEKQLPPVEMVGSIFVLIFKKGQGKRYEKIIYQSANERKV